MGEVVHKTDIVKKLVDSYYRNADIFNKSTLAFINEKREKGIKYFKKSGIPGRENENYKYTNLEPVFSHPFRNAISPGNKYFDINHIFKCDIPTLDTNVILLLNGFYFDRKTPLRELSSGALVGSFAKASTEYPELVEKYYGKYAQIANEGLVALNSAFVQDGIFIYVPKGVVLQKPLQIVNLIISDNDIMVQHRNLFVLEENTEATVIVCDHTFSPHKFLTNSVTEIYTGPDSRFDFTKVQNEHNDATQISHIYLNQERNSNVTSNLITLHGGLVRNNFYVRLNGEGCENNTTGLFLADKGQHIDNYAYIDHAKPYCTSNQLFKGVLDDFATGAFNGKILVRRNAQKTQAYQANNNILLTDDARMNTKPQLEIYADDVKCSHGATVGQLDENSLFYMRARGIGEREARLMLMYAFVNEIINQIKVEPLRERINHLVDMRLRGELSRCQNCVMNCG
ncbi:MAG: Fe-S cluster assembly protein SufD [Bacteroidetes bacterium]|nr:Fe-S cluster assembly protein SufD [Bacteroidota bacterium]